ncbi:hypothetical protein [Terriglobus roseus]|uniref:DUF4189 domain-containing protein n=1 Tax=Terriglobus roseus TaxID=392734 RepID=A0A1H4JMJ0_9BACT|nr:hypothetical protein [Terriglobus roseus]SEB47377.1 hypothetical protein SAMN05443244_0701 [Terriglobus roseus]
MRNALVLAATLVISLSAIAQTKVCMGGNLDTMTSTEKQTCENQVSMARTAAANSNISGDWHFVVVCGEDGWKDYAAFSQQGEAQLRTAAADTDYANKTTFLRGTRLNSAEVAGEVVRNALRKPATEAIQLARN